MPVRWKRTKKQIASLQKLLEEAIARQDDLRAEKLAKEKELLTLKNQQIGNQQRLTQLKMEHLSTADFYKKLHPTDGSLPEKLSETEWLQMGRFVDDLYDHFTSRLTALANLSKRDLRICYLIKLGVSPVGMASLLCGTKAAVTLARQRMRKKLTGKDGTAAQLDEFIAGF